MEPATIRGIIALIWAWGIGHRALVIGNWEWLIIPYSPCPMPHAPCPIPHAPCPMPHALFPIPNSQFPIPSSFPGLLQLD
ncbi:MAG: hypothetical protein WBL95_05035 [Microcoleus sp.]